MSEELYMPRDEVAKIMGYKSTSGFRKFVARTPSFPKGFKRSCAVRGLVLYPREPVFDWLAEHMPFLLKDINKAEHAKE